MDIAMGELRENFPQTKPQKKSLMDANGSLGAEAHTCFNQLLRCSQGRVLQG
jgi:hypothetical protein